MAAQTVRLTPTQAVSGAILTIALPTGPVTAKIPRVQNGRTLRIETAEGAVDVRVRVALSPGRIFMRVLATPFLLLMIALGPGALTASAFAPPPNPNAAPLCASQVMDPTDTCEITTVGGSTTYSYTQMQQMQTQAGWSGLIAVGATITVIDLTAGLIVLLKRRSLRKNAIAVRAVPVRQPDKTSSP